MIRRYLRHRRAALTVCGLVAVIFPGIAALYGDDLAAARYGLLILAFLLAVFGAWDFAAFARRVRALDAVLNNVSEAAHALPEAVGPIEAQYRQLARALYALLDEQAERLTRAHGEQVDYYTMWVHQIKTPIAAMRLALSGGARPQVLEEELFKVERYAEMALQFVKLSDLSGDLVLREYPLEPIVRACVKKYAPMFIGRRLKVTIEIAEGEVLTDQKWLSFILEQLLSNAVKYTERGGVTVRGGPDGLSVADTGIGILPEDLSRVFEKGYTGFNGRMDQRASGLGLYMAKRVADQLAIGIVATSEMGKGTRVTMTFPKRDAYLG